MMNNNLNIMSNMGLNYNEMGINIKSNLMGYSNYNDFSNTNSLNSQFKTNSYSNISTKNLLYVADLPEDTCEEDMLSFFRDYHMTMCSVTTNYTKVYSLVYFENEDWAEKARFEMNGVKISAKYSINKVQIPVRICKWEAKQTISERTADDYKKNLLIKNISKDLSAHFFFKIFREYGDIRSCKLAVDYMGLSKGYGYVTYYSAAESEKAKDALDKKEYYGKNLLIEFLQPGMRRHPRKNNIYVKHFPRENFTDQDLKVYIIIFIDEAFFYNFILYYYYYF